MKETKSNDMEVIIRAYTPDDAAAAAEIWNQVVEDGVAFPQLELLDEVTGDAFFREQSFTGLAVCPENGEVLGLYILHPNNIGRCGHIANASYAVRRDRRGLHIGEKLVLHSLAKGKKLGFRLMQFNAVVANNIHARHLYTRLGFVPLGVIPGGFRMPDGTYQDICPYYREL